MKRTSIWMPDTLTEAIEAEAKDIDRQFSYVVRVLLEEALTARKISTDADKGSGS